MDDELCYVKKSPLFYGIGQEELYTLLKCCGEERETFETGERIFRMGEAVDRVMILLKGGAVVEKEDFWGRGEMLYELEEGDIFGEVYACARTPVLPVSVTASGACEAMFLDYQRILTFCSMACAFHTRLLHNLLRLVSDQNIRLTVQFEHISRRNTRQKLLSFLSSEAIRRGRASFDISLSRQELADYLSVDRSAMSSELGKLKKEGILDFQKNHFTLIQDFNR